MKQANLMTDHNIKPSPELLLQWVNESPMRFSSQSWAYEMFIAHCAAQWGADVELQACCEWVSGYCPRWPDGSKPEDGLRAARRPKPPRLKGKALKSLTDLEHGADPSPRDYDTIRRALEALPND